VLSLVLLFSDTCFCCSMWRHGLRHDFANVLEENTATPSHLHACKTEQSVTFETAAQVPPRCHPDATQKGIGHKLLHILVSRHREGR